MAPFFERAVKGDCDAVAVAAGTLCCKLLERRAMLLGLDQPTQSRIDVYQVQAQQGPSRHERIKAAVLAVARGSNIDDGDGAAEPKGNGNGNGSDNS